MTHEQYKARADSARRIVFFGGAGVSTESGIPDFRSTDGLYNTKYDEPPETILSHDYFMNSPQKFYKFYFEKMICTSAKPNGAHYKLAEWEREGKLTAVVTQNIDGLHQAAGSKNVFELHGSTLDNRCMRCGKSYSRADILRNRPSVPYCDCGGMIKPNVTLYGEALPAAAVDGAIEAIRSADMLIVGGTSLSVYPAAGFVNFYRGAPENLILINKTHIDGFKNQFNGKIGELL